MPWPSDFSVPPPAGVGLAGSLFVFTSLVFTSPSPVCLVQRLPPSPHFASPQEFLPWVGCSLCLQLQATVKAACLPLRRRAKFIKHLLLTVKGPGYASDWQSPRWDRGHVRVWRLRNASNMFMLYRARQLTTCPAVRNQKQGWVKGGGCGRRGEQAKNDRGKKRALK